MLNSPVKKLKSSGKTENEITYAIGGIGTGYVPLKSSGALSDFNVMNIPTAFNPVSFFAVKAQGAHENKVFVLESKSDFQNSKTTERFSDFYNIFQTFDNATLFESFPFCETDFLNKEFPGKIHMTAWNPFIPGNDSDSGIPAVLVEYEVENFSDEEIKYTFYAAIENHDVNMNTYIKFSESRKDEIKYICLNNSANDGSIYDTADMCVGVCGKDINYVEGLAGINGNDAVYKLKDYILHRNVEDCIDSSFNEHCNFGVISSSFTVKPGSCDKVRFVISWYCPYFFKSDGSYEKKYYTRYFTGADECAFYCLSQWERLYEESDIFRQLLYSSTLPEELIYNFTRELYELKQASFLRGFDGAVYNSFEKYLDENLLISSYFPRLMASFLEQAFEHGACDKSALLNSLYNYFKFTGDSLFLEKVWRYHSSAISIDDGNGLSDYNIADKALELAYVVKDKKRIDLLSKCCDENNYDSRVEGKLFHNDNTAFSSIGDVCGLSIDLYNRYYRIVPDMNCAVKDVFQCILCFGSFLGFIERGIDYIQIKCIKGKAFVRKIEVPDIPLKVKCGGFEIGFKADNNMAILDNDCEINPYRDLLVIFRS